MTWIKRAAPGLALVGLVLAATPRDAGATTILSFTNTTSPDVTATTNGANTQTTIAATDAPISIGFIDAGSGVPTPTPAFFTLTAVSIMAAVVNGTIVSQHYTGSFSITSATGGGGTNYLSGTFTDSVFGNEGGTGLVLTANQPPDAVTFTSDVMSYILELPRTISLSFSGVNPPVQVVGSTIAGFDATVTGTFSATLAVPEPSTFVAALCGLPLFGIVSYRARRRAIA